MPPVKRKVGLTTTIWVLLVVLGLLVIAGVVLWMMAKGQPNYGPSGLREPRTPSGSLFLHSRV